MWPNVNEQYLCNVMHSVKCPDTFVNFTIYVNLFVDQTLFICLLVKSSERKIMTFLSVQTKNKTVTFNWFKIRTKTNTV